MGTGNGLEPVGNPGWFIRDQEHAAGWGGVDRCGEPAGEDVEVPPRCIRWKTKLYPTFWSGT